MKSISAIMCALVLLGSMAVVQASCCDDAKAKGEACSHACCKKAKKAGKVCEKCNPPKEEKK